MTSPLRRFATAAEGLAYEAELFSGVGQEVGIWTSKDQSLVCPRVYRNRTRFAAAAEASAARGWPVLLRPTGGGTVPQGHGVGNLALAFDAPGGFKIEDGYRLLVSILTAGLGTDALEIGDTPGSFCDGAWNLSLGGRKIIGTAQRWRPVKGGQTRVLAHAMILVEGDADARADAVSAFHQDLGLPPVKADVHTSLMATLGLNDLPAQTLRTAAMAQLETLIPERTFQ